MVLDVLTYPNKRLFQRSTEIVVFDDELGKLLDNMYETMLAKGGIGLAAIQVGRPVRAFIINLINENEIQDKNDLIEFINPVFLSKQGETTYQEGCLSVPGFFEEVTRANEIIIEFYDRFGNKKTLEAKELLAVALQHENDHLDGHLFIEKIGFNKRKKFDKEFKKKVKSKAL